MSPTNLPPCLADLCRHEEVLAAIGEAVTVRRELAARWPDAYRRERKSRWSPKPDEDQADRPSACSSKSQRASGRSAALPPSRRACAVADHDAIAADDDLADHAADSWWLSASATLISTFIAAHGALATACRLVVPSDVLISA
jgi:hypothetical protein